MQPHFRRGHKYCPAYFSVLFLFDLHGKIRQILFTVDDLHGIQTLDQYACKQCKQDNQNDQSGLISLDSEFLT